MIYYVDKNDMEKFTEDDVVRAKKAIPSYYTDDGSIVTDCVFFNDVGSGRILSIPILLNPEENGSYCQPEKGSIKDANNLFNGLMFIYAYNIDRPDFSEGGSARFDYVVTDNGTKELRRIMGSMQCIAF